MLVPDLCAQDYPEEVPKAQTYWLQRSCHHRDNFLSCSTSHSPSGPHLCTHRTSSFPQSPPHKRSRERFHPHMVWVASSTSLCSAEQKGGDRWWPLYLWDPRRVWPASQFPAETTLGPPSVHAPKRCQRLGEGQENFSHSWGSVSIREAPSRDLQVFMWPKFREEALSEFTHSLSETWTCTQRAPPGCHWS